MTARSTTRRSLAPRSPTCARAAPCREGRRSSSSSCATATCAIPSSTSRASSRRRAWRSSSAGDMSKREILQTYLNGAFYGSNAYGVEAAARTYFSRPARRLALVQAAMIAGLPQAPSRFDPARHRAAAKRRRNQVLAALRDAGEITPRRYAAARRHPLRLTRTRRYRSVRYPAFFEAARRELVDRYGLRRARRGGLRVKTTVDPRLQHLAESAPALLAATAHRPRRCARGDRPGDRRGARDGRARARQPPAAASTSPPSRAASRAARSRSSRWRRRWRPASRSARSGAVPARGGSPTGAAGPATSPGSWATSPTRPRGR